MRLTIVVPRKLATAVQRAANSKFTSRSEWVRQAIVEKIERESKAGR